MDHRACANKLKFAYYGNGKTQNIKKQLCKSMIFVILLATCTANASLRRKITAVQTNLKYLLSI